MTHKFEGHTGDINDVAFSPDGTTVVSASDDETLILWDIATGQIARRFEGHHAAVTSVAFSPDGRTILSGSCASTRINGTCEGGEIALWDVNSGEMRASVDAHRGLVNTVEFNPDGQQALSASQDAVILWQVSDNSLVELLHPFDTYSSFRNAQFDSDGAVYATLPDGTVIGSHLAGDVDESMEGRHIWQIAFSPVSQLAVFTTPSIDNGLTLVDMESGQDLARFLGHTDRVSAFAFSPGERKILSGTNDGALLLWSVNQGTERQSSRVFTGHEDYVSRVAVSPDGQTILAGGMYSPSPRSSSPQLDRDFSVLLWDAQTGDILQQFEDHTDNVWDVDFSPDGTQAITASADGTLVLRDLTTGQIIRRLEGEIPDVFCVSFSPDGQEAVSGSWDSSVVLWDLATGDPIRTFTGHRANVMDVAFSPDGTKILSGGGDDVAILWNAETGEIIHRLEGHTWWVDGVAFSPDGKTALTSSSDATMILWDVESGEAIRHFEGHRGYVLAVAFSPDGRTALSGSRDETAILWDIETGEIIRRFEAHSGVLRGVAFSPDGRWAVTSATDSTVRMWLLPETDLLHANLQHADLLQWAESNRFIRDFTCEEREEYRIEPLCTEG